MSLVRWGWLRPCRISRASALKMSPRTRARCWSTRPSALAEIRGLRVIGTPAEKAGIVSFVLDGVHPHDVGTLLDRHGMAIRTGHHCCQPLMDRLGLPATVRASLAVYNSREDIDALASALQTVRMRFA